MEGLVKRIIQEGKSLVIFKTPDSENFHLIYGHLIQNKLNLNEENFVLQLFDDSQYCFENPVKIQLTDHGLEEISSQLSKENFLGQNRLKPTSKREYITFVEQAIHKIKSGEIHKIVPSKIKVLKNKIDSISDSLINLRKNYPETLITFFYDSTQGTWIGASPEVLLKGDTNSLSTTALAGTQVAQNKHVKEASWSQKEIEEQALVSRYIINCFKKIRLREYHETGPKTIKTGKLFHLKTDYNIVRSESSIDDLDHKLIELLHPTSAVCGMPKDLSKKSLVENEKHDRKLYTGFWGPTSEDGFQLYVNIRLAQVFQNEIVYYSGAGITEDSIPENEWNETESKCDNLALKLNL